jgi:GNAT superfamily N-acetyltransferase
VAVKDSSEVIGFALGAHMDGHHHLQQLSVLPAHGRRGVGRALVEAVCTWALEEGGCQVTLSTFCDIPWNGPYYERLGFRALSEQELGPELLALRADEQGQGLDIIARVVMRRDL